MGEPEEEKKEPEEKEDTATATEGPKPFDQLDLNEAYVFGWNKKKTVSWYDIANESISKGWKNINIAQLEKSFALDVEASYFYIASFYLTDLEDEVRYLVQFDNNKMLWKLSIENSPKAELEIQQVVDFFKSQMFNKIKKRTYEILDRANKMYDQVVKRHLNDGELLEVNEVKLGAILHFLNQDIFMKSILDGKYIQD